MNTGHSSSRPSLPRSYGSLCFPVGTMSIPDGANNAAASLLGGLHPAAYLAATAQPLNFDPNSQLRMPLTAVAANSFGPKP